MVAGQLRASDGARALWADPRAVAMAVAMAGAIDQVAMKRL